MPEGVSVLLGTFLGGCIGIAIEIVRSRNERRQRLLDERRKAYARLLAISGRLTHEARMLALRLPDPASEDADRTLDLADVAEGPARETANRYVRLFDEFREVYEEVRLLAGKQVGSAAWAVFDSMANLGRAARSSGSARIEGLEQAEQAVFDARRELRRILRADLRR